MAILYRKDGESLTQVDSPSKSQCDMRRKIEELRTLQAIIDVQLRRHVNSCIHRYVTVTAGEMTCVTCSKTFRPEVPENDDE